MKVQPTVRLSVLSESQDRVELVNQTLRNAGLASHCGWARSAEELRKQFQDKPELIIVDTASADLAPAEIADFRARFDARIPVLFIVESITAEAVEKAFHAGANDVVQFTHADRLVAVTERELHIYRSNLELDASADSATQYKKQIKVLMADMPEALAYVQEGIIVDINPAWLGMMGYQNEDDLIGQPVMDTFAPQSRGPLKGAIVATLKGAWHGDTLEIVAIDKGQEEFALKATFLATAYDGEPCVKINCSLIDDGPNTRELKLQEDAQSKDPTTMMYHRPHFVDVLRGRLRKKPQSGIRVLAWIKPDRFENVCNDIGHIASETVFAEFADLVSEQVQPKDVAGRFCGLSLMVLLERPQLSDAEAWGQLLVDRVSKHVFQVNDRSTSLTCTIGLCMASEELSGADQLVLGARSAYERGKQSGGNSTITNETSDSDSRIQNYDAVWARHLKSALMENRFRLLQQPVVSLDGTDQDMFDLLVRMIDQRDRPVLPSEFIPAAERNNMMHAIDRWVIAATLEFCRQRNPNVAFIKLSRNSLQDPSLVDWFSKQVEKSGIGRNQLCIEVSEENAARFIRETKRLSDGMRRIGVMFALEHVGIGRRPGHLIGHFEPNFIKIDGSLIATIAADETVQRAVKSIVEQANGFGTKTIAERVEDANTMAVLWQLGIHYMQGHYVHEPEVVLQDAEPPKNVLGTVA